MIPHKQGEHVFNNFVRTIENMKEIVIREVQVVYPEATKEIFNKSYKAHIGNIERHPLIVEGRMLNSAPSGELNDTNSNLYGHAAFIFQEAMRRLARSIVQKIGNPDWYKGEAKSAWKQMTQAGIDPAAYERLLHVRPAHDRVAFETVYRRTSRMLQHEFPSLGSDIIRTIAQDLQDYVRQNQKG